MNERIARIGVVPVIKLNYCKYTNVPSFRTAESIGMHFVCEYPDEAN